MQANKAAILALTMNRLGDMGLSIGFFALFAVFGTLDYSIIFNLVPTINETIITIIGILLLSGAMAKSAQIPLHSWLPGSMEGPTPVSALIHAATLVTAGIYLLLRSSPILEYSSTALLVITLVGATTAFFAATCGLVQNDLKRIIAFSTISQLGYMTMAIGISQYNVALFHTVNHAFFKALLFLGAGAVIHSFSDQQDIRKLGGLINFLPFTYTAILVGSLSLLATPWLTGFYSKDLIIELAYGKYTYSGTYAYILGTVTAGITAFYSFRLISLVFLTVPNGPQISYIKSHEANFKVIIPLFILGLFSIFFGFVFSELFVGVGTDFFGNSLYTHPNNISIIEAEFSLSLVLKLLPAIFSLLGASLAIFLYHKTPDLILDIGSDKSYLNLITLNTVHNTRPELIKPSSIVPLLAGKAEPQHQNYKFTDNKYNLSRSIYTFLNSKYYFDVIYNEYIIAKGLKLGHIITKYLDKGIIELVGPLGLSTVLSNAGIKISKMDTGIITSYALYIVLALITLLLVLFAPILLDTPFLSEIRLIIIYLSSLILVLW